MASSKGFTDFDCFGVGGKNLTSSALLFIKLALRNLIRNRVRTFLNLSMVVGAFVAIIMVRGFAHYMLHSIEIGVTEGQFGHIQIAKAAIWEDDLPKHKDDANIEKSDEIENILQGVPGVNHASGRASAFVLLVNRDKSVGAQALGYKTGVETNIEKFLTIASGTGFSKDAKFEILVGQGLQKTLQLEIGQTLSIISQTLSGSMSSLDLEVRGVVNTGFSDLDSSVVYIPLSVAQKLLKTERVERVAISLNADIKLEDALANIKDKLKDRPDLLIKSWKEKATLFQQLTDFYKIQNFLVEIILSCLVFFGILNTLGMSIYERIGELGTLRALGDRTESVLFQLILEALLMGCIGILIAAPLSAILAYAFSSLDLPVTMPGASRPMPVHIEILMPDYFIAGTVICLTCIAASIWPIQKAMRLSIVDALRANS